MSFLLFLVSGGISTLLDLLLFQLLHTLLAPGVAYVFSYTLCVTLRYGFDSYFTFHASRPSLQKFLRYGMVSLIAMLLGLCMLKLAMLWVPPFFAKLLSIPVTLLTGFLLLRRLVFRRRIPATAVVSRRKHSL